MLVPLPPGITDPVESVSLLIGTLEEFIVRVSARLLSDPEHRETTIQQALRGPEAQKLLTDFALDGKVSALYLESYTPSGSNFVQDRLYQLQLDIERSSGRFKQTDASSSGVAFIKRVATPLEEGAALASQLQIASLWGRTGAGHTHADVTDSTANAILALLQQYTRYTFAPLVRSSILESESNTIGPDGRHAAYPSAAVEFSPRSVAPSFQALQKKVTELDLCLVQCQKATEIPKIELIPPAELCQALLNVGNERLDKVELEELGLEAKVHDDAFLNALQRLVNSWVKDIQRVTRLTDTAFPETALDEISFWRSLEEALEWVREQLRKPGVKMTVKILRQARRIIAVAALENNTGLDMADAVVSDRLAFLRDLPINALLSSATIEQLRAALGAIFQHLLKLKQSKYYDLERAGHLVESISRAFAIQLKALLSQRHLMLQDFGEFQSITKELDNCMTAWRLGSRRFEEMYLGLCKRRVRASSTQALSGVQALKVLQANLEHLRLQQRLEDICSFRAQHQRFCEVVSSALEKEDSEASTDIETAYGRFLVIDIFDITPEGKQNWAMARAAYDQRIDKLEDRATRILCERLGSTQSAEEMCGVFSKFNTLLFRPRIQAAVLRFQVHLIKHTREAVQTLQNKFTLRYEASDARMTATMRDLPLVTGKIVWAKQIESQLRLLTARMEHVLGPGWDKHVEGKQLKAVCAELLRNLDTDGFFKKWIKRVEDGFILSTRKDPLRLQTLLAGRNRHGDLCLQVGFEQPAIMLFKEVRNLQRLGFRVPAAVRHLSDEAADRYPYAMALHAALQTFSQIQTRCTANMELLLASHINDIREVICKAFAHSMHGKHHHVRWDSPDMPEWVGTLSEKLFALQEKTYDLVELMQSLDLHAEALVSCPYNEQSFAQSLMCIQKVLDDISLAGYVDIDRFVSRLKERLEFILLKRLSCALQGWVKVAQMAMFSARSANGSAEEHRQRAATSVHPTMEEVAMSSAFGDLLQLDAIHVDIALQNQTFYVSPSIEVVAQQYTTQLHVYLGVVCNLPCPRNAHVDLLGSHEDSSGPERFTGLASRLSQASLCQAYQAIKTLLSHVDHYVREWLQYQALWDMNSQAIVDNLGSDLKAWLRLLTEMKDARVLIDVSQTEKKFGPLTVNLGQILGKINLKYDAWQKDMQAHFAAILSEYMRQTQREVIEAKYRLETAVLEGPLKGIICGVTAVQEVKQQIEAFSQAAESIQAGERLLLRQRFLLPPDWLQASVVVSAICSLQQILARRCQVMQNQLPSLQQKVRAEDQTLGKRISELSSHWSIARPMQGDEAPPRALQALAEYERLTANARSELDRIQAAKNALSLESSTEDPLRLLEEDLAALKEMWGAILNTWTSLQKLKEAPWPSIATRKTRQCLENLSEQLRGLPNRVRQYEAVTRLQAQIRGYQLSLPMLAELKTDALKDRHWRCLITSLNVPASGVADLCLGHLLDIDLSSRRATIQEVLSVAQGEMALEVFLQQVRDYWSSLELELVVFRNRTRLIRGWDVLFAKLEEHLNALATIKLSPYFQAVPDFQEKGGMWEERLSRLKDALEIWISVQRRWVYLESIFLTSADIKCQLPFEYTRFKSIDSDFVQLMRKVTAKPSVPDVLQMDNLLQQLERQDNMMTTIQKALGEYLKRQRASFPRFFFVGDEDLLEIIGNVSNPIKVTHHLSKMFAGLAQIKLSKSGEDGVCGSSSPHRSIVKMMSREGEEVALAEPVSVTATVPVRQWLECLETQMRTTLASLLPLAVNKRSGTFISWVESLPSQIVILASQIMWSSEMETCLTAGLSDKILTGLDERLLTSVQRVLMDVDPQNRKKFEQLITEFVYQREVARELCRRKIAGPTDFAWLYHLRFYLSPSAKDTLKKLEIRMANASFDYSFEYLGIGERLVQTPLTDKCYLTLTQALHAGLGGNPFGPAGTGKTESVKALGSQLGRFVVVFNCDERFDYNAMGRLLIGLCQVGAWGCFDEFNRLREEILSAVSQHIMTIQKGLACRAQQVHLLGEPTKLHPTLGIFITMNPGYAGRSDLPSNLKQLFRAVAMTSPDGKMIAQILLYSQGIEFAEELAGKIILLFQLCKEQLSLQSHYDFGLRALKSVLLGAGALRRKLVSESNGVPMAVIERNLLVTSACTSILPKLVVEDVPVFKSLLQSLFPGAEIATIDDTELREAIKDICHQQNLVPNGRWVDKLLQLRQMLVLRHGVMLVGVAASGKSTAWRTLFEALSSIKATKGEAYVIDPKAISKEQLYGTHDSTTLEWTDGIFTSLLRQILANVKGERERDQWIVFDGDIDPVWAENLNSVLDDNRLFTLPNGERLEVPDNLRIIMEVDSLQHATMATVSRCGMVWFSHDTLSNSMLFSYHLAELEAKVTYRNDHGSLPSDAGSGRRPDAGARFVDVIRNLVLEVPGQKSILTTALQLSSDGIHVMEAGRARLIQTFFSLLSRGATLAAEYDELHPEFPMQGNHMERFATRWFLFAALWGLGSSLTGIRREEFGRLLAIHMNITVPSGLSPIDLSVRVDDGEWVEWSVSVPRVDIQTSALTSSDALIPTTDTIRHVAVLHAWLASRRPAILCGPPGSGKSMTLVSTLQSMPNLVLASLDFSSGTGPELIHKIFAQYCEFVRTPRSIVLQPAQALGAHKWLVVLCDEINLPATDAFGTQRVLALLRQLTEHRGFWRNDNSWVILDRITFVGTCNPPTDPGRVELSPRFLRHAPVLYVDLPSAISLAQIYGTFTSALLRLQPSLLGYQQPLTQAMLDYYFRNQAHFTSDQRPHYVYSPRELSRWVRGLYEAVAPLDTLSAGDFIRLWAHEALRLFHDRLTSEEERQWAQATLDQVTEAHFPGIGLTAVARPILFSKYLSKTYKSVDQEELRDLIAARLKIYYEEELDVPLVVFDEMLEHVLRIDAALGQSMSHLLLIGESGVGKTVLSKFVSWMNGLSVFQVKASSQYTLQSFEEDLRRILKRAGAEGEKICFIFDESNILSSAFLERMNALLASGEVPGLFEGDEYSALMNFCRDQAHKNGVLTLAGESHEGLYRNFVRETQHNLHVVFTLNPASSDFQDRCTTSPALFNRCIVDWFGTWSTQSMAQVAFELTARIDMGATEVFQLKEGAEPLLGAVSCLPGLSKQFRQATVHHAVVACLVAVHMCTVREADRMALHSARRHYLSPRDFLDLIRHFTVVVEEKRAQVEEQQLHINIGLQKLASTQEGVMTLQAELTVKSEQLKRKDEDASAKLQQMIDDQNEAERRKIDAGQLSYELDRQNAATAARRREAERDLSEAEPALIAAQAAVKSIKKQHLDEVRALARPPASVRLTLEAVLILLGETYSDWTDVRRIIRNDGFIATVVKFDPESIAPKQVKNIIENYLTLEEFEYEKVDRASKACGPLQKWVSSQLHYSTILSQVQPLREEVIALQAQGERLKVKKDDTMSQISKLEQSILRYKAEYTDAIREIESIKGEIEAVRTKVCRAEALLSNLASEKDRWHETAASFELQTSSTIGDSLLAAAFLTYVGNFDFRSRGVLLEDYSDSMVQLSIPHRQGISPIDFLSRPARLLEWHRHGLLHDQVYTENAIVLERCNRFPLIIDPTGQINAFLLSLYASRKIQSTSVMDIAFLKRLASAIRFGTPLLVQDIESVDPILNPLLNREIRRTGGRTTIQLGNEEIDFSPKFLLFLATRNSSACFSPDLCSRVTLVNFTMTPASLRNKALSKILQSERPEVDQRRNDLLRLQGEQSVKLRSLEDGLLEELSAVQGNILDDDRVIRALESLKAEAADVVREISSIAEVVAELQGSAEEYEPLAAAVVQIHLTLERLSDVHFLYRYPIEYLLSIVDAVLAHNTPTTSPTVPQQRVQSLKKAILTEVARRVAKGLYSEDQVAFAFRCAQIYLQGEPGKEIPDTELDYFCRGAYPVLALRLASQLNQNDPHPIPGAELATGQITELRALTLLEPFKRLWDSIHGNVLPWHDFLRSSAPESCVPDFQVYIGDSNGSRAVQSSSLEPERLAFLRLLLIRAFRQDRIIAAVDRYVTVVLGPGFSWRGSFDLSEVVDKQLTASMPLLLCFAGGHDANSRVDALAQSHQVTLDSLAMGSQEGFTVADHMISKAASAGSWVLLRNIHLCLQWLGLLEQQLNRLLPHPAFRLFLTSEISPCLPHSLLRQSDVIVVQPLTGMKANVRHLLLNLREGQVLSPSRLPAEKTHVCFLAAWLHSLVCERLRYLPVGWTYPYEFSQADAQAAMSVVEQWLETAAAGRPHISPDAIPWKAMQTILSQSVYGGRIDNPFDQALLDSFVKYFFSAQSFDVTFSLVETSENLRVPDATTRAGYLDWLQGLPNDNSTSWLGLSSTSEAHKATTAGQRITGKVFQLQDALEAAEEETPDRATLSTTELTGGPQIALALPMQSLLGQLNNWLSLLGDLPVACGVSSPATDDDPLQRCLAREIAVGQCMAHRISEDLSLTCEYLRGTIKATQAIRALVSSLAKDVVPEHWIDRSHNSHERSQKRSAAIWVADLAKRLKQHHELSMQRSQLPAEVWLGGLLFPEAYLTATRQMAAMRLQKSLENLHLRVSFGQSTSKDSTTEISFAIRGLSLLDASIGQGTLCLSSSALTPVYPAWLCWSKRSNSEIDSSLSLPLYLNESRRTLLAEVAYTGPRDVQVKDHVWRQRGVALMAWSSC